MRVDFLYYEDCPSHEDALEMLRRLMAEEGIASDVIITKVETEEQAQALHFVGSPTIRINGQDVVPVGKDARFRLTCRAYTTPEGRIGPLPPESAVRRALKQAQPQG